MSYIAVGSIIVNHVYFADGRVVKDLMGGGGLFAFCGIRQYTEDCLLLSGAGSDYPTWFGEWFRRNGIREDGMIVKGDLTSNTDLHYFPDGRWFEESIYGREAGIFTFGLYSLVPRDIEPFLQKEKVKGIYVGHKPEVTYWKQMAELRQKYGFKLMCEIGTQDCKAENYDAVVERILPAVDIYSLNRPESFGLFSVDSERAAIAKIQELGVPCYYRVGKKGAYMVTKDEIAFCPSVHIVPEDQEVDPTGCGNCSTGAAMYAFAEGYDAPMVAIMGSVAAGYTVRQHGPYPDYSRAVMDEAMALCQKLRAEWVDRGIVD